MNPRLDYLREKARQLPPDPGVYLMKDAWGGIIYVGKAKALRNRVSSYFRSLEKHTEKVWRMVQNADDFTTIVTASEFEALVLECSLIKLHKPKYNILLKDDKGYHYIHVSEGQYPRVTAEKMMAPDAGGRYLGPFTSSFVVTQTVDEATRAFQLPTCRRKFPEDFGKGRPCLNFHIKQCMGVCRGRVGQKEYAEIIDQVLDFIRGGGAATIKLLTERMEEAAGSLDFERAASLRDRIRAIERIGEQQNVVITNAADQDVAAIVQNAKQSCAVVIKFRGQRLVDKQEYMLGEIDSLPQARRDFLLSLYGGCEIPKVVALDGPCEDDELVERYLSEKRGGKVMLHIPERGEGRKLVEMASANAAQQLAHKLERTGRELAGVDALARLLGLAQPPVYIEAYDISNFGADTVVGGMVVFENGRPLKAAYKKFNIKTVEGPDDYASMREVLSRRVARYAGEQHSGEGFGRLPDLILLDGGAGHVSAVAPILEQAGWQVPLLGMVKDKKHRTRAITGDGGEISISQNRSAFTLVSKIQDEAHRYSITFMKQRHTKNAFATRLTQVEGIGEKRASALLRHFKTQKALREADADTLAAAPGMTEPCARRLWAFLHEEDAVCQAPEQEA